TSDDLLITNNTIDSVTTGMYLSSTNRFVVDSNIVRNVDDGIFHTSAWSTGEGGVFSNNRILLDVTSTGIGLYTTMNGGSVTGNHINAASGDQAILIDGAFVSITANSLFGGEEGIRVQNSNNTVSGNSINGPTLIGIY